MSDYLNDTLICKLNDCRAKALNEIRDRDAVKIGLACLGYSYNSANNSLVCSECPFAEWRYKNISLTALSDLHHKESPHCSNACLDLDAASELIARNLKLLKVENGYAINAERNHLHAKDLTTVMARFETFDKFWEDTFTADSIENSRIPYYMGSFINLADKKKNYKNYGLVSRNSKETGDNARVK